MAKKRTSLRDRLMDKKKELKNRGNGGGFIMRQKEEGTIRFRILPTGDDNDFAMELTTFWLSKDAGEVISPVTFGEPCPVMEKYQELKESKDPEDANLAKKLVPRRKYVIPVVMYKDGKGSEIDTDNSNKLLQITGGIYQEIIDLYLDEDEWGDMTDPKEGYDLKQTRTGTGQKDTNYTISACKNTPLKGEYAKIKVDLEEMARGYMDTYETAEEKLEKFLGSTTVEDDDEEEQPRKSKRKRNEDESNRKRTSSGTKKKRRSSDI